MSTGGHSYRRWGSAGSSSAAPPRRSPSALNNISATVEPSTYGTSWNSVRWNKPSTPGYRSQSSRIASSFEREKPTSYYLSTASTRRSDPSPTAEKYLSNAAKIAHNLASLGPSINARASRFDSSVNNNKYRSEARDLISKYTSKERPTIVNEPLTRVSSTSNRNDATSSSYRSTADSYREREPSASRFGTRTSDYPYRKSTSVTPTRTTVPALSRYSSEARSITSPTPSRSITSPGPSSHVIKQERPWRQRMAEGARVRALHGDDVSASYLATRSQRRTSIGRDSGDELSTSLSALRSYVTAQPVGYRSRGSSTETRRRIRSDDLVSPRVVRDSSSMPLSASMIVSARKELAEVEKEKAMSRSYSPARSSEILNLSTIPRFPTADISALVERKRSTSVESSRADRAPIATVPRDATIQEEEFKAEVQVVEKRRTARERSARILSRQSSQKASSSDEDYDRERDKEEARKRRRASCARRSQTREMRDRSGDRANDTNGVTPRDSKRSTPSAATPAREEEPLSPRMGNKITKSASTKKMVPTKKQIMKSPSYVEVSGTPKRSAVASPSTSEVASPGLLSPTSPPPGKSMDTGPLSPQAANMAPIGEDESMYNAVANFRPAFKPRVKPIKPVPGTWKKEPTEENISKNKTFEKPSAKASISIKWKGQWSSAKKTIRVKPKTVAKKEKEMVLAKAKEAERKAKEEEKLKKEEEKKRKDEEKAAAKKTKAKEKVEDICSSFALSCTQRAGTTARSFKIVPSDAMASPVIREKAKKPVKIEVNLDLKDKNRIKKMAAKCEKTLKMKSPSSSSAVSLQCSSSTSSSCSLHDTIQKKHKEGDTEARAKVHVVTGPEEGINMSRVRLRCRAAVGHAKETRQRQSLPVFPDIVEELQSDENLTDDGLVRSNSERDSRAAAILNEMRMQQSLHRRLSEGKAGFNLIQDPSGPLVLPDHSILEEYIRRKRGKLEAQQQLQPLSEATAEELDAAGLDLRRSIECDSPYSTCSDLLPAPEVRIFSHSPRHSAQLTTPSRRSSCSRLSSVEASTPTAMLDTMQAPGMQTSQQGAFNTPGFLRHGGKAVVTLTAKPLPFDAPKTPFEASLQNQANRIRNAGSLVNQPPEPAVDDLQAMQRSGHGAVASTFTAALAASHPRHERYAAHLPHRTGDHSGRTSAASVDSTNSGALDTASKQLDNMLDQARYKHQAHRHKFKEAIDYLDNIFEDLKKECGDGPSGQSTANASPGLHTRKMSSGSANGVEVPPHNGSAAVRNSLQRDAMQKAAALKADPNGRSQALTFVASTSVPNQTNSLPNRSTRHRQPVTNKEPSPVEISIKPVSKQTPPEDLEVSETLVLPKRTDKLDFTRRWLADDLAGFAKSPPQLIEPGMMYGDADEHSIGSCSAEVAAINTTQKKRRESKPKESKPVPLATVTGGAEKRLAPYRPQPVYAPPPQHSQQPGQHNGTRFPLELDSLQQSQQSQQYLQPSQHLSRVASYDRLSERLQAKGHSDVWRSTSQEPSYNTLGSARSDDASRPSPSAFTSVTNFQRGGMRGSIKSLPDAGLIVKHRGGSNSNTSSAVYYPDQPRDPVMAIDALCAELELNTDQFQNPSSSEKRRSFPIGFTGKSNGVMTTTHPQPQNAVRTSRPEPGAHSSNGIRYVQPIPQQQQKPQQRPVVVNNQPKTFHQPQPQPQRHMNGNGRHNTTAALDEVTNMLATVSEFPSDKTRKVSGPYAAPSHLLNASSSRPFDTINQERIQPSRVEAIQSMFENRRSSGHGAHSNDWRGAMPKKNSRDEDNYFDIGEYAQQIKQSRPSPPPHRAPPPHNAHSDHNVAPLSAYPTTQPPSAPPPGRNGSAGSSQNGGYYSSNSSGIGQTTASSNNNNNYHQRRGSLVGRQSVGSRNASLDDEDDGFYDNIGIYGNGSDDRRFSRGSELGGGGDNVSISSARLPPANKPTRIGSFLSKIGARSSGASLMKPPGSAASLVSLNKVAVEAPIKHVGSLMKSSSLSHEPWRVQIIENGAQGKRREGGGGLGTRLKNSLFGSKKRLNQ